MKKVLFILIFYSCMNKENKQLNNLQIKEKAKDSLTRYPTKKEIGDTAFLAFWKNFSQVARSSDYNKFKKLSLDSIEIDIALTDVKVNIDTFINTYFHTVFNSSWVNLFFDNKNLIFSQETMEKDYISGHGPDIFLDSNGNYVIKTVQINKPHYDKKDHEYPYTILEFAKTQTGFKFITYSSSSITKGGKNVR